MLYKQYMRCRLKNPVLRIEERTMKNRSRITKIGKINNCYIASYVLGLLKTFLCSLSLLVFVTVFHVFSLHSCPFLIKRNLRLSVSCTAITRCFYLFIFHQKASLLETDNFLLVTFVLWCLLCHCFLTQLRNPHSVSLQTVIFCFQV